MCACMHDECGCIRYDDAESRTVGAGGCMQIRVKDPAPRHLAGKITAWAHPYSPRYQHTNTKTTNITGLTGDLEY